MLDALSGVVGEFTVETRHVAGDFGREMIAVVPANRRAASLVLIDTKVSVFVSVARRWEVDSSDAGIEGGGELEWAAKVVVGAAAGVETWAPIWLPLPSFGVTLIPAIDSERPPKGWVRVKRWQKW